MTTKITLQLKAPQIGQPMPKFPAYGMRAFWTEDGKIGVVTIVIRSDGGAHIIQDTIDPPAKEQP